MPFSVGSDFWLALKVHSLVLKVHSLVPKVHSPNFKVPSLLLKVNSPKKLMQSHKTLVEVDWHSLRITSKDRFSDSASLNNICCLHLK